MRAAIFNGHMLPMGGTERVILATIDVFSRLGWEVDLYVLAGFKPTDLASGFGTRARTQFRVRTTRVPAFFRGLERLPRGGVYLSLAKSFIGKRVGKCDLFIDMIPLSSLCATYSRTPDLVYWNLLPLDLWAAKKRYSLAKRLYLLPLRSLSSRFPWKLVKAHVANSWHTRNAVVERLDSKLAPIVIYPPVDLKLWSSHSREGELRNDIASFARFDPWKRHDLQLRIVRGLGSHLRVLGRAITETEVEHLRWLRETARGDEHVEFCVNLPQTEVKKLLRLSKVFIHTADAEPFGITTVEAIAAGCVPVVRDDGAAPEIVPFEELRFKTIPEGREKVRRALDGEYDHLLPKLLEHIQQFSQEAFGEAMMNCIVELSNRQSG